MFSFQSQKFSLQVLASDILELEVKHKSSKSRPSMTRFLGRCTLPVQTLVEQISADKLECYTFSLVLLLELIYIYFSTSQATHSIVLKLKKTHEGSFGHVDDEVLGDLSNGKGIF